MAVDAAASVHQVTVALGGAKGQTRLESDCRGRGASFRHFGAVRADGDQHFDFWIRQLHSVPHTEGLMDFRGVATDRSRVVFNAMIDIPTQALHTDAVQKFRGLTLSSKSTIDASPKLEIATHEVKCSHGVSISTVDPDQIYYLTSRGISRSDAEWMVINGFTQPIVQELPTEALRTRFHALMEQKHGATS